ncbi:MAG: acyltransferase [Pseudomonadales bacterium]|nr:acyltransferase [Pseudomonadales bacterium]
MRSHLKDLFNLVALLLLAPCAALLRLFDVIGFGASEWFRFCSQMVALVPGIPGNYLRRAYYRWVLTECAADCQLSFGVLFSHREARVESGVYVGPYTLLGHVVLREGCLLGSRVSIVSGRQQHAFDSSSGRWLASDLSKFKEVEIGPYAWIGEGAIVMADIGAGSAVAAGSVVSAAIQDHVVVAGNPARFVRKLVVDGGSGSADSVGQPHPSRGERDSKQETCDR